MVMSRDEWDAKLSKIADQYEFKEGYKILYNRWRVIGCSSVAFISLNPGALPSGGAPDMISDERGNSAVVERETTNSPITEQVLKLYKFIKVDPSEVLSGVLHPFRSDKWCNFSAEQRRVGINLGIQFWKNALDKKVKTIIVCGKGDVAKPVTQLKNARLEKTIPAGWGGQTLDRYLGEDGSIIVVLPHLSRFKLFSRGKCWAPLKEIFSLH